MVVWVGGVGRELLWGGCEEGEGEGEGRICYGIGREKVRQGRPTCDLWIVRKKSVEGSRGVKVAGEPGGEEGEVIITPTFGARKDEECYATAMPLSLLRQSSFGETT